MVDWNGCIAMPLWLFGRSQGAIAKPSELGSPVKVIWANWLRCQLASRPQGSYFTGGSGTTDRHPPQQDRGLRCNDQIRISPVRLIGAQGEQLGIVPTAQALDMAREAGQDLVEVAPNERPPVCKILDYGKLRYQQSRKGNKASKVHQQKLKEIRVRPKTGDHDVDTKINQAPSFSSTRTRCC